MTLKTARISVVSKILGGLSCYLMALAACGTPLMYSAEAIRGQIVDAETGQPIDGAVVVAQWVLFEGGIGHGGHKGRLHIFETVTDEDGRYLIPEWGPKPHPPLTELVDRDPEILIFKSTYEPKTLRNSTARTDSARVSEWDGRVVKLKRAGTDLEAYARHLESMSISLPRGGKEWRTFPRMVLALDAENRRLLALGLDKRYRTSVFEIQHFDQADKDFLKGYEHEK